MYLDFLLVISLLFCEIPKQFHEIFGQYSAVFSRKSRKKVLHFDVEISYLLSNRYFCDDFLQNIFVKLKQKWVPFVNLLLKCSLEKTKNFRCTLFFFRNINYMYLVTSLVKMLLSRKICQKNVREFLVLPHCIKDDLVQIEIYCKPI